MEAEAEAGAEVEGEVEAEVEMESEAEVEAEVEADVEADVEAEVEVEAKAEADDAAMVAWTILTFEVSVACIWRSWRTSLAFGSNLTACQPCSATSSVWMSALGQSAPVHSEAQVQPSPAQPSPAQPSPAQPSPAQPSTSQPSPAQLIHPFFEFRKKGCVRPAQPSQARSA